MKTWSKPEYWIHQGSAHSSHQRRIYRSAHASTEALIADIKEETTGAQAGGRGGMGDGTNK